jgi:hypothetical protein
VKAWLFWDWWHIEHQDNVQLCQGRPQWVPEATYEDPGFDYLACWPAIWRDEQSGLWRMVYPIAGFPLYLMGAESEDGVHWRAMDAPEVAPGGEKVAPNHLFTIAGSNGGPVYVDPIASDGRPFKLYCIQRGGPVADRARLDPDAAFHEIVTGEGVKPWMAEARVATSADGLNWRLEDGASWGQPGWHPDPCTCAYYVQGLGKHMMTTRPGWGDRRLVTVSSDDALTWGPPELILQPDPVDPPGTQFYGMPVFRYENTYVGFLFMSHFDNALPLERFNQLWGYCDSQLTYSFDGVHWQRGLRETFVGVNEPGLPASGVIYPTRVFEVDGQLRIYSASTRDLHHQYGKSQYLPKGEVPPSAIVMHTLRKDGFMYLASRGNWAAFTTKPLVLLEPELKVNALAPHGEVLFQLTDLTSQPIEGYTFDRCIPLREGDELGFDIRWRDQDLSSLVNRAVRLQVRFRHARIHAFRGSFHFADALDVALLDDGRPIDSSLFDF